MSYLEQAKAIARPFVNADPNDARAGNELLVVMENEAQCFENRAQAIFMDRSDGSADAAHALKSLSEARFHTEHLLQTEPDNVFLRSTLGLLLVPIGRQQLALHQTQGALELATKGVAI